MKETDLMQDERMELAAALRSDLFAVYLVTEIDKVDEELDKPENQFGTTFTMLMERKNTLQKVREAYQKLKG